jgi:lipooligosaccharide transport system permease protein
VTALERLPAAGPRWGALHVAEYRIRNMWKWRGAILAFGLGHPILYLASIGLGVGLLVDANSGGVDGVPYLIFLGPALMATAAVQGGGDEATFPTLAGFIWNKLFYSMRATSLTGAQIATGVLVSAGARVLFTSTAYWLVLALFGAVGWDTAPGLIAVGMLGGLAWGALMLAVTGFVQHEDGFMALMGRLVVMPMFMFSGTFYPLDAMPLAVRWLGWISPLWHTTELGRWVSYGAPLPAWQILLSIGYLLTLLVVGLVIGRRQFERRLTS